MSGKEHTVDEVFGASRQVPLNYVVRESVDGKLLNHLSRGSHIVIYGSAKQGKRSLLKKCLEEADYKAILCRSQWGIVELHSAILKGCGYSIWQQASKSSSRSNKNAASIDEVAKSELVAEPKYNGICEHPGNTSVTDTPLQIEIDQSDVNDIITAVNAINCEKRIVLEDFHHLPDETQREFAFSLKELHDKSKITVIIIGIWREENRIITYNGDLTGRVLSIDADNWERSSLNEVIAAGESILNVQFDQDFKKSLLDNSFGSVHVVQEVCRRCLINAGIFKTCNDLELAGGSIDARDLIREVVGDQGGRYLGFLMNFSDGFQQTELEISKWIIYSLLKSTVDRLRRGLTLREISGIIKLEHPTGSSINNSDIRQALISVRSLQIKNHIRPIIIDYDCANDKINVVDNEFLLWLGGQDIDNILASLDLPSGFMDADI